MRAHRACRRGCTGCPASTGDPGAVVSPHPAVDARSSAPAPRRRLGRDAARPGGGASGGVPSASYTRSANASAVTARPAAAAGGQQRGPGEAHEREIRAIPLGPPTRRCSASSGSARRPVVEGAVRLDVAQRDTRRPRDRRRARPAAPAAMPAAPRRSWAGRAARTRPGRDSPGCAPTRHAQAPGERDGPRHHQRVAGVGAAGDVRGGHQRQQRGIVTHRPGAIALAHVGIEVDRARVVAASAGSGVPPGVVACLPCYGRRIGVRDGSHGPSSRALRRPRSRAAAPTTSARYALYSRVRRGDSSAGRASAWHAEGPGFEPPSLHHPSPDP